MYDTLVEGYAPFGKQLGVGFSRNSLLFHWIVENYVQFNVRSTKIVELGLGWSREFHLISQWAFAVAALDQSTSDLF
jgi:hypothetical protein